MRAAFPRFIRLITKGLFVSLASVAQAAAPTPAGKAMEPLLGVPYQLFARQSQTESRRALNCITAVMYALRRMGYVCPNLDFYQGFAFWWPRAKPLRLGETPVKGRDVMLLTRSHFLLLHTDQNNNGVIDAEDLVIHANFKPVEINTIAEWLKESPQREIRYLPVDDSFVCPSKSEAAHFRGPLKRLPP